jgi:hypothetical protein
MKKFVLSIETGCSRSLLSDGIRAMTLTAGAWKSALGGSKANGLRIARRPSLRAFAKYIIPPQHVPTTGDCRQISVRLLCSWIWHTVLMCPVCEKAGLVTRPFSLYLTPRHQFVPCPASIPSLEGASDSPPSSPPESPPDLACRHRPVHQPSRRDESLPMPSPPRNNSSGC